jgi:hypothetical protein
VKKREQEIVREKKRETERNRGKVDDTYIIK